MNRNLIRVEWEHYNDDGEEVEAVERDEGFAFAPGTGRTAVSRPDDGPTLRAAALDAGFGHRPPPSWGLDAHKARGTPLQWSSKTAVMED